ncbi:MAG: anti-sigma factor [Caulobacteraceae bacterium]|nr:anti-sigma factor [Caulobacteraceae bacterium]
MDCVELLTTQAFLDGELANGEAKAAELHIAGCAECQAFCEDAVSIRSDLRSYAQRYAAPDRVKLRVREAIAAADVDLAAKDAPAPAPRRGRLGTFFGGFLGGVGVSGLAAALWLLALAPPTPATMADRIVRAHTQALISGNMIQVASGDHHTVKPWFAGKIDLSPPVHDFAAEGFKLTGGRIDRIAGRPAAVVVYQHGFHWIDLFVWADRGEPMPAAGARRGYNELFWKQGDLDFAAVSDMQADELANFVDLVRTTGE